MAKSTKKSSEWFCKYDLAKARRQGLQRKPEVHQSRSLDKLIKWYSKDVQESRGGNLMLPTGAGKTFTATHFLCRHPLSAGRKEVATTKLPPI
jgi:superfamily II DNA or RNA helicase